MKAKFLFILLSVLFIIPVNAAPSKKRPRKAHFNLAYRRERCITRTPSEFNLSANESNGTLSLNFQSYLPDAEITVTDKDGNTVVYEPQSLIYEGKVIYIYTPEAYPYTLEIISPAVEIIGEIVLEEN